MELPLHVAVVHPNVAFLSALERSLQASPYVYVFPFSLFFRRLASEGVGTRVTLFDSFEHPCFRDRFLSPRASDPLDLICTDLHPGVDTFVTQLHGKYGSRYLFALAISSYNPALGVPSASLDGYTNPDDLHELLTSPSLSLLVRRRMFHAFPEGLVTPSHCDED